MAQVDLDIGGRRHTVSCRDGEEPHLRRLAAIVAEKVDDARRSVGEASEVRQLLFAALLLADDLHDLRRATPDTPAPPQDIATDEALSRVADRLESLASALEAGRATA